MLRVYAIQTELTRKQNTELLQNISDEDSNLLTTLEFNISIDLVDENDYITTIIIGNVINLEKLKSFLLNKGINFEVEDITEMFIDSSDEDEIDSHLKNINEDIIFEKLEINA